MEVRRMEDLRNHNGCILESLVGLCGCNVFLGLLFCGCHVDVDDDDEKL